jgi:SAM-dependent methyltransferase
MAENQRVFESKGTVRFYAGMTGLQKPEQRILDILRPRLPEMRVLEIGVGGGRTTRAFAPLAKDYVGIDYAEGMVEACRKQFPDLRFSRGDVRDLSPFDSASFDLVLFAYNGIDAVSHDDRLRGFAEVRRVLAPGGTFVFSTHNLAGLPGLFAFSARRPIRSARLRLHNPKLADLVARPWAVVRDGAYAFKGELYYVRLDEQLRQLRQAGFDAAPRVFGLDGREVSERESPEDLWLYFLV